MRRPRRILLTGEPRLYLQALAELLESIPGVSASLVPTGEIGPSEEEHAPELVLVGCPAGGYEPDDLCRGLRKSYPDTDLVMLESGLPGEGAHRTMPGGGITRFSTRLPLDELVSALCDPKPISTRPKTHQARSRYREEWPLSSLSDRELSVLSHVVAGRSNHETAEALGISRHTVRTHLQNIMAKMMVRSRTELISVVMRARIRIATDAVEQDG